ncbi:glycosyltransferase family 2 protein [Luteolibacter luteus]|uniref:Glycosyltransferase n=1 Tax=Luteolibacter luteus TaxID=2728835 RepID=A0A858RC65_9BACT|nr:glycosyltransferase family 2 protein [Luteolibacter luteus]QJE94285.1 glycosyltransferase [Luteolibacter luteus]
MTKVSICIPCHNAAAYVAAALDSVLAQTWPSIEIIVVNDGSTDDSAAILDRYLPKGVRVIHERMGSAAKARNRAAAEATGDFIKFFDADDLLSPAHIELQMKRLAGRCDAIAVSEWGRFYDDDPSTFRPNPQSVWRDMEGTEWLVEALHDARPMMQPGMFLIPRAILEASGGWDEELSLIDDFEFFSRTLSHAKESLFTPGAVLYYRSGISGSLSGRKSRKAVESAYHSLLRGTGHLLSRRSDKAARLSCANVLQDFIYTYYPEHADLRATLQDRIAELGGSNLSPDGPPRFQQLRKLVGWRLARRVQLVRDRQRVAP